MDKLRIFFKKYYFFLTPILFWLSFPFSSMDKHGVFSVLAWVCIVPAVVYFRDKSIKDIYKLSFILGIISSFAAFGWMKFFGSGIPGGTILITLLLNPLLAAFWVTKFVIAEFLRKKFPNLSILIYPCIWTFIDFIKSLGFLAFPWTYLGYTQYHFDSLIQITSYTGIFGLTWIIVFTNTVISEIIINYKNRKIFQRYSFLLMSTMMAIGAIIFFGLYRINYHIANQQLNRNKNIVKVGFVQSCISPFDDWENNKDLYLNDLISLSAKAMKKQDDTELLLWTESSTLEYMTFDYINKNLNYFEKTILEYAKNNNVNIITGEVGVKFITDQSVKAASRYKYYNSAVHIDNKGRITENYDKIFLTPFGEWFPYEKWLPWIQDILSSMQAAAFSRGERPEIFEMNNSKLGMLICYESMFFRFTRRYKTLNPDYMVIITNDGWTDYYKGHMQHFCATKFRAIETGLYYLRAGNTGYTAIVNPLGIVEKSIPILEKTYMTGKFDANFKIDTFYSKNGDIIFYLIEAGFIIILAFCFFMKYILKYLRRKNEN